MSVYFAQSPAGGPIKIGTSSQPEKRVRSLLLTLRRAQELGLRPNEVAVEDLRILAIEDTDKPRRQRERELQRRFSSARADGVCPLAAGSEWFHPTRDVVAYIEAIGGRVFGPTMSDRGA